MEKIKIITDSSADLPKEILDRLNVSVLPLLINFGEESYLDGIEITLDKLFEKIDGGEVFPNTAQVTPIRFEEAYRQYLNDGYKIISIHLSSNMSGTYQSACLAKNNIGSEDIYIIDSQTVTSGLALLVYRAAKLRDEGKDIEYIINEVEERKNHIKSSLSFDSLDNLVKGGRISKTVGVVTGMLGIKLILEVKDGIMAVKDKVRGGKKAAKKIIDDIEAFGIEEGMPVLLINVDMDEVNKPIKDYLIENNIEFINTKVGCTVGIHSGNHATGVFFFSKK